MSRQPCCTLPRVALVLSFVSVPVFGETPRTPWGDPDLQGMWVNNSATPLERPDAFQGKETLTDEELQELNLTLPDGRKLFMGSSGTGAPKDGADPTERKQGKPKS